MPSVLDLTCKRGSVGQSGGLLIPRSSVPFRQRPFINGTKLLLRVIKAIIVIIGWSAESVSHVVSWALRETGLKEISPVSISFFVCKIGLIFVGFLKIKRR